MDAFHAQKWRARQTPAAEANPSRRQVRCRQSRHWPVAARGTATSSSENPSRHTAMVIASAAERRTSGPAKETPSSERASIQYGLADMVKKKEPVRLSTGSFSGQP